jgi:acetoin utilization deacetylase AcuC-like enzyme
VFNDQAVAARAAQRDCGVERILFVDLDVHQARLI